MREERRGHGRVSCAACVDITTTENTITALAADLSLDGCRVVGAGLPSVGTVVEVRFEGPAGVIVRLGRVCWSTGSSAGISLRREGDRNGLRTAMLAFAYENESPRPAALVLVADTALAARVATTLRGFGYVPRIAMTPLDVARIIHDHRPRLALTIIGSTALGIDGHAWLGLVEAERPDVRVVTSEGDVVNQVESWLSTMHPRAPVPPARRKHHVTRIVRRRA